MHVTDLAGRTSNETTAYLQTPMSTAANQILYNRHERQEYNRQSIPTEATAAPNHAIPLQFNQENSRYRPSPHRKTGTQSQTSRRRTTEGRL